MAMQPSACARLRSEKMACTFSLRTKASSSVLSLHVLVTIFSWSFLALRSASRHAGVLNHRRRRPSNLRRRSIRRQATGTGKRTLKNLVNVAKSQYLDAWYKSLTLLLLLFAGTIFCEFLRFGKNRKIKYPQKFLPTHHHCGVCTITNCVMLATFGTHANHSLLIFSAFSFILPVPSRAWESDVF